jgi:hypothetical protein
MMKFAARLRLADTVAKRFLASDRRTFFTLGREWGILI